MTDETGPLDQADKHWDFKNWEARMALEDARWERRFRRQRRLAAAFMIPYSIACVAFGFGIYQAGMAEIRVLTMLLLVGAYLTIVFCGWTQPILLEWLHSRDKK